MQTTCDSSYLVMPTQTLRLSQWHQNIDQSVKVQNEIIVFIWLVEKEVSQSSESSIYICFYSLVLAVNRPDSIVSWLSWEKSYRCEKSPRQAIVSSSPSYFFPIIRTERQSLHSFERGGNISQERRMWLCFQKGVKKVKERVGGRGTLWQKPRIAQVPPPWR